MKKIILLIGAFTFLFPRTASAVTVDHLVISQVQTTGGAGKTTNDFIEIHNPTGSDIDLMGMRLVKRTETGTSDTSIKSWTESAIVPAGGYYLWANADFVDIGIVPDATTSASIADNNGIALRLGSNDTGTIVDSVGWGSASNAFVEGSVFPINPAMGEVLIRNEDTDNNAADFIISTPNPRNTLTVPSTTPPPQPLPPPVEEPDPEPTPLPSPPPPTPTQSGGGPVASPVIIVPGAIKITQALPNPKGSDSGYEWVELTNTTNQTIDLMNSILDDGEIDTEIGKNHYKVPAQILAAQVSVQILIPTGKFALNNSGEETIRLFDSNRIMIDSFNYTDASEGQVVGLNLEEEPVETYSEDIRISEIYPSPAKGEEEFIELHNDSDAEVVLKDWVIADSSRKYKLPELLILPHGYIFILKSESKIALNNYGEEKVSLINPNGEIVDLVKYEDAPKAQSYSRTDDEFEWSIMATPGQDNQIAEKVEIVEVEEEAAEEEYLDIPAIEEEITESQPEISSGIVAAVQESNPTPLVITKQNPIWPWFAVGFVLGAIICYILIRLMNRKELLK